MKRKIPMLWSLLPVFIFLFAGCSPAVHVEKDDKADFTQYRTFAWLDQDGEGRHDRNHTNDLTEQKMKDAITKEIEKTSGWREARNRPDILLSYDVLVERSSREVSNPVYSRPYSRVIYNPYRRRYMTIYYPSQFIGYDRDRVPTREGTVTITMIDAKTEKTIWQGWTTDEVNSRNLSSKEIQTAVRSIFRKFDLAKK